MSLFVLFQTGCWKTKASRIFFGIFDSRPKAIDFAKYNHLYSHHSEVVIVEVELNQFQEI
ncbi:hypothetical protein V3470_10475 [Flavobacterium oreochromis]|uniref:DUF1330 domain-containing protein n=1 Tax=Flavobacterium oreochromis TaxID=2906078 RepID=A0ABW8PCW8_9FLAO|nr:hypothetical protein [Flavobacterium oreochromis]OWP74389.1 hypothetical protein BWG23_14015 [Flavobacterium oreochromis]